MKLAKTKSKTNWREISISPMVRWLLIGFVVVMLIEGAFLALICTEAMRADAYAEHEVRVLRATASFSSLADSLLEHRRVVDHERWYLDFEGAVNNYVQSRAKVMQRLTALHQAWETAKLPPASIAPMSETCEKVLKLTSTVCDKNVPQPQRQEAYNEYIIETMKCYPMAATTINELCRTTEVRKLTVDDAWRSVVVMLIGNVIVAFTVLWLLDLVIIKPIIRLANNCELLASAQRMPEPKSHNGEIGLLENALFWLSVTISDNEKSRRSYVELLRESQVKLLEGIATALAQVSEWPQAKQFKPILVPNVERMLKLEKSLADQLSGKQNQVDLQLSKTSTTQILQAALGSTESRARKKGVSIQLVDPGAEIEVDEQMIERVVTNLLSNAVKFAPEGSVVSVTGEIANGVFKVSVEDKGPGISAENQKKLFEKYSQLGATTADSTGLGLVICKEMVEAHGGSIGVNSVEGTGSTFWFELPTGGGGAVRSTQSGLNAIGSATNVARGQSPRRPSVSLTRSIKVPLIAVLGLFLIGQSVAAMFLYNRFEYAAGLARQYNHERQLVTDTQMVVAEFCDWRDTTVRAVKHHDLNSFVNTFEMLKQNIRKTGWLADELPQGPLHYRITGIQAELRRLAKFFVLGLKNFGRLDDPEMKEMYVQADRAVTNAEESLFAVLRIENEGLEKLYGLGKNVSSEIYLCVAIAVAGDVVALLLFVFLGLRLRTRIDRLNDTVRHFGGAQVAPSVSYANLMTVGPGMMRGMSAHANDELTYLERCLRDAEMKVQAAHERRQELIAVINHDVRTPLTSTLAALEMIFDGVNGELDASQKNIVSDADRGLLKILDQVNNLLAIEKSTAGLLSASIQPISLSELIENTVDKFRSSDSRVAIEVCSDAMPAEVDVLADGTLMEWVLKILIENAVNASQDGGVVVVRASMEDESSKLRVRVEDKGTGIPQELVDQLFERFRVVDGKTLTGLGLPLAHRLCELQDASLVLEQTSPAGTIFGVVMNCCESAGVSESQSISVTVRDVSEAT